MVNEEAEKCKEKLSLSMKAERVAHDKATELSSTVKHLEQKFQTEVEKHQVETEDYRSTIDKLQSDILDLHNALKHKNGDHLKSTHRLESDLEAATKDVEAATKELRSTREELEQEKRKRASLESANKLASETAENAITSYTASIKELRLENVQKDVSFALSFD